MGFQFKQIGHFAHKIGNKLVSGVNKIGNKVKGALMSAESYVKEKALPVVEKVAGLAQQGLKMALPAITAVAPELAPFAMGASAIAGKIKQGSGMAIRRPPMKLTM